MTFLQNLKIRNNLSKNATQETQNYRQIILLHKKTTSILLLTTISGVIIIYMDKQMSLEEFKKQVRDCLLETYKLSTTEVEDLMDGRDEYWQELLNDGLTPQETAFGRSINLL